MNAAKKARLLAAGYTTGTVAEFLQLSLSEHEIIEARVALTNRVTSVHTEDIIAAMMSDATRRNENAV